MVAEVMVGSHRADIRGGGGGSPEELIVPKRLR